MRLQETKHWLSSIWTLKTSANLLKNIWRCRLSRSDNKIPSRWMKKRNDKCCIRTRLKSLLLFPLWLHLKLCSLVPFKNKIKFDSLFILGVHKKFDTFTQCFKNRTGRLNWEPGMIPVPKFFRFFPVQPRFDRLNREPNASPIWPPVRFLKYCFYFSAWVPIPLNTLNHFITALSI